VQQSNIIDNNIWKRLFDMFQASKVDQRSSTVDQRSSTVDQRSSTVDQRSLTIQSHAKTIKQFIHMLSIHYNIDKKQIIKDYYNYLIMNHPEMVVPEIIDKMEIVIHNYDCKVDILLNYFIMDTMTF
jgi:hypothetical protein